MATLHAEGLHQSQAYDSELLYEASLMSRSMHQHLYVLAPCCINSDKIILLKFRKKRDHQFVDLDCLLQLFDLIGDRIDITP